MIGLSHDTAEFWHWITLLFLKTNALNTRLNGTRMSNCILEEDSTNTYLQLCLNWYADK